MYARKTNFQDAVIYARVSSQKQVDRGHGLEGQILHCSTYASQNGYNVLKIYSEEGISGAKNRRPQLDDMLAFIKSHSAPVTVLVYDVARMARSSTIYYAIRDRVEECGGRVLSVTQMFDRTPSGRFVENIMVAYGELERHKNTERTHDKMSARLADGYYVISHCPVGYKSGAVKGVKEICPNIGPTIKLAIEGYAYGSFSNYTEIANHINAQALLNHKGKLLRFDGERAKKMLEGSWFHAGFVQCPKWGIARRKGHHEPLISMEILELIECRLLGKSVPKYRKNLNLHFPLRGHVLCDSCGRPMTASFCGGKTKEYAYYYCRTHGCIFDSKHIPKELVHGQFQELLKSVQATSEVMGYAKDILTQAWNEHWQSTQTERQQWGTELSDLEERIQKFVDELIYSKSAEVKKAIQKRVEELASRRDVLKTKIEQYNHKKEDFDIVWERMVNILSNPERVWIKGDLSMKQTIQRMVFPKSLIFAQKENKFRKPEKACVFGLLEQIQGEKPEMARPKRFELLTF